MAEVTNELIYEVLKLVQLDCAETRETAQRLERRVSALEDNMNTMSKSISGIHADITTLNERTGRIERRLNMVETAPG